MVAMRYMFLPLLVFFFFLPKIYAQNSLSLEGSWQIELVQCQNKDKICKKNLLIDPHSFRMYLPQNLHQKVPWFHGVVKFSRQFKIDEKQVDNFNLLIAGSIGSEDEVLINGILVGSTGYYFPEKNQKLILSSFNKLRVYNIPAGLLKTSINTIEIYALTLDVKAGVHTGPLLIGNSSDLILKVFWLRLIREYIFLSIPILLLAVLTVIFITVKYWGPDEGNLYLAMAFIGYFIHSLYYIPVPWFGDYLLFLKLHWSGRIISVVGTILYFYRHFGLKNIIFENVIVLFGLSEIASIFLTNCSNDFFQMALWQQWSFFLFLWYPFTFSQKIKKRERFSAYKIYLIIVIPVTFTYLNDTLIRSYTINTPWMYHYMSIGNVINFLYHFTYQLYLWREYEKSRAAISLMKQKLDLSDELHDMVGSQLSQLVVISENLKEDLGKQIASMAKDSLEKVRDFSHLLKEEKKVLTLNEVIQNTATRLRRIKRFHVSVIELPEKEKFYLEKLNHYACLQVERILSEWISNLIKHTKSDVITIGFAENQKEKIRIFIKSNETQFRFHGRAEKGGLFSMQNRASSIGAHIASRPCEDGTILLISL